MRMYEDIPESFGPGVEELPLFEMDAAISVLNLIHQRREEVRVLLENTKGPSSYQPGPDFYTGEYPPIISILGARGSGKTTVLRAVLRKLCNGTCRAGKNESKQNDFLHCPRRDPKEKKEQEKQQEPCQPECEVGKDDGRLPLTLVTKILDPETLKPECDPLGWILASLSEWVDKLDGGPDEKRRTSLCADSEIVELRKQLEKLVRMHYASRTPYLEALTKLTQTAAEYSDELGQGARWALQFEAVFRDFVAKLLKAFRDRGGWGEEHRPLLVIPFDDVDLVPEAVPSVLDAVRHLLSSPYVVVLLAGDLPTFEKALRIEGRGKFFKEQDNLSKDDEEYLDQLTSNKLRKLLPQNRRVQIRELSPAERVDVLRGRIAWPMDRVLGQDESKDALHKWIMENRWQVHRLFEHDDDLTSKDANRKCCRYPSLYASMLPETIRGACHLRDALIGKKRESSKVDLNWLEFFCQSILDHEPSFNARQQFYLIVHFERGRAEGSGAPSSVSATKRESPGEPSSVETSSSRLQPMAETITKACSGELQSNRLVLVLDAVSAHSRPGPLWDFIGSATGSGNISCRIGVMRSTQHQLWIKSAEKNRIECNCSLSQGNIRLDLSPCTETCGCWSWL